MAYAQASVIEPVLDRKLGQKPGDLDMLLLPVFDDPSHAISIQVKRVPVKAVDTGKDRVGRHNLGDLTALAEQANGSRELGFHINYAMVIVQVDGARRTGYNFAFRTTTPGQFKRIYHRTWDLPWHPDVGIIFVEIAQPTQARISEAGMVLICVDKFARPIEQRTSLTAKVLQLTREKRSL